MNALPISGATSGTKQPSTGNKYSLIALEDLKLHFMTANRHLSLSAHDAASGEFQQMLTTRLKMPVRESSP